MTQLDITHAEIENRAMSPGHLAAAVHALRTDGFVVLNGVIDLGHLEILHAKLLSDLAALQAREDAPYNWNAGNLQQDPPPFPPYLFRDVLLNDMAIAVTKAVLGPGVKNSYYSGNTALPGDERQPVHTDSGQLWPDLAVAPPAAALVVNVPTVDMGPENGSTELWPGTHLHTGISVHQDLKIPPEIVERRRAQVSPIQPRVRRGALLIRDIRLWHAGMPNRTRAPRPMLAMIHNARWLETGTPLRFPVGTEDFFEGSDLRTCARFVEGPIDYIRAPRAYEYTR